MFYPYTGVISLGSKSVMAVYKIVIIVREVGPSCGLTSDINFGSRVGACNCQSAAGAICVADVEKYCDLRLEIESTVGWELYTRCFLIDTEMIIYSSQTTRVGFEPTTPAILE